MRFLVQSFVKPLGLLFIMCHAAVGYIPGVSSAETVSPVRIVVFGDTACVPLESGAGVYVDQLHEALLERGVASIVENRSQAGSHSGSRMDNDKIKVAHGMDRFTSSLRLNTAEAPDFAIVHFGLEDAWIDGEPEAFGPRIPLPLYRYNLESFVDRLRDKGVIPILITPNPVGDRWGRDQQSAIADFAQACRQVSAEYGVPIVDLNAHLLNLCRLYDRPLQSWLVDERIPASEAHRFLADRVAAEISGIIKVTHRDENDGPLPAGYSIPVLDLADQKHRQVIVDREEGQYLGHPTTCLLEDGKTMLCVYPKGHGRGPIVYKTSVDGGLTWSDRLPVPDNWSTSLEVPTLHRVVDADGNRRVIMWSGLYPSRLAVSEDDGAEWSPLQPVGDWGGIVVMGCLFPQNLGDGRYMALFHDDGRFFTDGGNRTGVFTLYKTFSKDGGLTWNFPEKVYEGSFAHLCEPGVVRSPDGRTLAVLLRENSRRINSHVIFSTDEGLTWSQPRQLPAALTGDRHTAVYSPDGRLFISFRDTTLDSPTKGDWVGWVGTFDDIANGTDGQYRVRLMENHKGADCAYPGVEILPDGTIVTTTYGHWEPEKSPYIVSVRLSLDELDKMAAQLN